MSDAFKRVAGGEGREVLLVSGEAGLGKTTLVAEAARAAFDGGRACCSGIARKTSPRRTSSSARRSATTSPTPPKTNSSPMSRRTGRSWPGWSRRWRAGCRGSRRRRRPTPTPSVTCSSRRWSDCWSWRREHQPVVLVLDDLQWADKASLQLLRHLIAAEQTMRLSWCSATYRDSELSRSHPLLETLAALHRQHGVSRIELAGLDDTGVMALMEAARRSHPRRRRGGSRPCAVSRDRRQPVLRERGAPSISPRPARSPRTPRGRWVAATTRSNRWPCPTVSAR